MSISLNFLCSSTREYMLSRYSVQCEEDEYTREENNFFHYYETSTSITVISMVMTIP